MSENGSKKTKIDESDMGQDVLADQSFDLDLGKIMRTAAGENAVECEKKEFYTLFAKNFACNICSGVFPGNETTAEAHIAECRELPSKNNVKTPFCRVCWRLINADNVKIHLTGSDHNRILAYRERNNDNDVAYWITNSGATQVKPLGATPEKAVAFKLGNWADRLFETREALGARSSTRSDRILNQIKTAVQSGSGNRGAISAKLGENSALIAALDTLMACATIGFMPCHIHGNKDNEHNAFDMHRAVQLFFKTTAEKATALSESKVRCKGSCKQSDGKYKQCSENLRAFDEPQKLFLLLEKMRETIIGDAVNDSAKHQ
jgi:hypothetical protein